KTIIEGLTNSIDLLRNKKQDISWYDSTWFLEDLEPILGISLIALQNYINGSIKDFSDTTNNKTRFFKFSPTINGFEKSGIELIIGLANFYKHKEDTEIHSITKLTLESFELEINKDYEIENSPIIKGILLLDKDQDLNNIIKLVKSWRDNLWATQ
ncbi:MAG: hypothetical protein IPH84_16685, partial [Bacteroidales bacterium]|nr:hypothetical protein [Bacteroidales bacterium]